MDSYNQNLSFSNTITRDPREDDAIASSSGSSSTSNAYINQQFYHNQQFQSLDHYQSNSNQSSSNQSSSNQYYQNNNQVQEQFPRLATQMNEEERNEDPNNSKIVYGSMITPLKTISPMLLHMASLKGRGIADFCSPQNVEATLARLRSERVFDRDLVESVLENTYIELEQKHSREHSTSFQQYYGLFHDMKIPPWPINVEKTIFYLISRMQVNTTSNLSPESELQREFEHLLVAQDIILASGMFPRDYIQIRNNYIVLELVVPEFFFPNEGTASIVETENLSQMYSQLTNIIAQSNLHPSQHATINSSFARINDVKRTLLLKDVPYFDITMERYYVLCRTLQIPPFPVSLRKAQLFFLLIGSTACGKSLQKLIPKSLRYPIPTMHNSDGFIPGEGNSMTKQLLTSWIEHLSIAQRCTEDLWPPANRSGAGKKALIEENIILEILNGIDQDQVKTQAECRGQVGQLAFAVNNGNNIVTAQHQSQSQNSRTSEAPTRINLEGSQLRQSEQRQSVANSIPHNPAELFGAGVPQLELSRSTSVPTPTSSTETLEYERKIEATIQYKPQGNFIESTEPFRSPSAPSQPPECQSKIDGVPDVTISSQIISSKQHVTSVAAPVIVHQLRLPNPPQPVRSKSISLTRSPSSPFPTRKPPTPPSLNLKDYYMNGSLPNTIPLITFPLRVPHYEYDSSLEIPRKKFYPARPRVRSWSPEAIRDKVPSNVEEREVEEDEEDDGGVAGTRKRSRREAAKVADRKILDFQKKTLIYQGKANADDLEMSFGNSPKKTEVFSSALERMKESRKRKAETSLTPSPVKRKVVEIEIDSDSDSDDIIMVQSRSVSIEKKKEKGKDREEVVVVVLRPELNLISFEDWFSKNV